MSIIIRIIYRHCLSCVFILCWHAWERSHIASKKSFSRTHCFQITDPLSFWTIFFGWDSFFSNHLYCKQTVHIYCQQTVHLYWRLTVHMYYKQTVHGYHWRPVYLSAKCCPNLAPSPRPWTPGWPPAMASRPNCILIWNKRNC